MGKRLAYLVMGLAIACGPGPKGGDDDGDDASGIDAGPGDPGSLRIEPADAEVAAEPGLPGVVDYKAIYTDDDGNDIDVTDEAIWTLVNPALGSFAGAKFTSATDRAGVTLVRAAARGKFAETSLTVRLRTIIIGPGADSTAPGKFGGADDPSRAPTAVYPSDGTLVPPNLTVLEFHFAPGTGNTLFRWTYKGALLQLEVYLGCQALGSGCQFTPDAQVWTLIAEAERGQAPGKWSVSGVDGANPGGVGTSGEMVLGFGQDDIVGGLYYWNAGGGVVMRYDFGLATQTAENFLNGANAGPAICVGCHAMSRDGTKIAAGLDIPGGQYKVFTVADRSLLYAKGTQFNGGASFFSFNPDATQLLASNGINVILLDAQSGSEINANFIASGAMPDWSADGNTIVFSKPAMAPPCIPGFCTGVPGVDSASLELLQNVGGTWMPGPTLVPFAGKNNYYPSISPSNEYVIFNQSPANANSFDAPDAQVWAVAVAGGAPMQLTHASTGAHGDSWPKWAPDVQQYRGGALMWFTFSSRRPMGLRPPVMSDGSPVSQIWMAAFDPQKAAAGEDPSFSAFLLPFQDFASGNHIAQWVTEVQRDDCMNNDDCQSGEFCEGGVCLPDID